MTEKKTVGEKLEEVESWDEVWECRECDYADVLGIIEEDVSEGKVDTVVCPNCGSENFEIWRCHQWSEKANTGHI